MKNGGKVKELNSFWLELKFHHFASLILQIWIEVYIKMCCLPTQNVDVLLHLYHSTEILTISSTPSTLRKIILLGKPVKSCFGVGAHWGIGVSP